MLAAVRRTSEAELLIRHISAKGLGIRMLSALNGLPCSMSAGPLGKWGLPEVCHLPRY